MQISGLPTRISVPFASSGKKNTIPVDSQIGITAGAASFTDGFPPLTMTSVSAGGVPPYGADFNGILNAITVAIRWNAAGSGYPFDSDFASSVAGYPEGALLPASDYSGYWLNTVDANSTAPENSTSETTGWVPGINYGVTAITGLSGSSVTLTTLQASKSRITLAGTLTANINLIFPAWTFSWTLVNNCTGNFSVTCTTASGTGVVVPTGLTAVLVGDGTNIIQDSSILGITVKPLNVARFDTSGTWTCPAGVTTVYMSGCGGGGGGGGGGGCTVANTGAGGGGGGGAGANVVRYPLTVVPGTTYTITLGAAGSAGTAGSVNGGNGGAGGVTSFGSLFSLTGGGAGSGGTSANGTAQGGFGGLYGATDGGDGSTSMAWGGYGGSGGSSPYGTAGGGGRAGKNAGSSAHAGQNSGFGGGGGGGAYYGSSAGSGGAGSAGGGGFIFLEW